MSERPPSALTATERAEFAIMAGAPNADLLKALRDEISDLTARLQTAERAQLEICICAAIVCDDGTIMRGQRHVDCLKAAADRGKVQKRGSEHQGFVTSRGRYVNREEAARLQIDAGIESADQLNPYVNGECYSEDLY